MKTLIIEDEPTVRLLFEKQIRSFGHEVFSCTTGEEALQACQQTVFSLCMLDLGLPDMDGIDLCRRIRALPIGRQMIILIITGRDTPEDLDLVRRIFNHFKGRNDFSWLKVLDLFERQPELIRMNLDVTHKSFYDVDERWQE